MSATTKRMWGTALLVVLTLAMWDTPWLWPARMLVVMFHELSHGLAALLTGGSVVSISLDPREGGLTYTRGGLGFVIVQAGYLGSLLFGVGLLAAARTPRGARIASGLLAAVLFVATLLYVRPIFSFSVAFTLCATLALGLLASRAPGVLAGWVLRWLGVISVLYALWDVRSDVLSGRSGMSDASILASQTGIPAVLWGLLWLGLGLGTLWATRRWWR